MYPILIKIGPVTIHSYGFLLAVGFLCAIVLSFRLAKKQNIDLKIFADLVFYTIIIGLLGGKLFLIISELGTYIKDPAQLKYVLRASGTFYGGLILGTLFAVWYIRKRKLDVMVIGDIIGPSIALAHFFGRLGCFCAGCCWGRHAGDSFLGVTFTSTETQTGVPLYTPLYPTQLMEAFLNLCNFIFLMILYKKKKFKGQVFIVYIFNYSVIRFFVEYFRGDPDPDRGYIFGGIEHPFTSLSIAQLISIIGIIISIVLYRILKKKKPIQNK